MVLDCVPLDPLVFLMELGVTIVVSEEEGTNVKSAGPMAPVVPVGPVVPVVPVGPVVPVVPVVPV